MKRRRVKFVWGASRVIRGRWYLGLVGLYDRIEGERDSGIAISLRGILAWGAALMVVAYVAAATALFWIWQRNPYSLLTYTDAVFYPVRRASIAEKKGQAFIAQGQELYRAKKWADAVRLLQLGLARYPRDLKARLTLAQFYLLTNQRPVALRWLEEGLTAQYPGRPYLETLFNLAQQGEDYELVATTSARYLPELRRDGPATELRWLLERRFAALMAADRPAEALALAEKEELGHTASEHRVLALCALGRAPDAETFLEEWGRQPGADVKLVRRLQVRVFREVKKFDEMERALAELRRLTPGEPGPFIYAVVQESMAGRAAEAGAALEDFLFRFGGTAENLATLAAPLGEIRDVALLQRLAAAARERGYPQGRFQAVIVQAQLQLGEWDAAARSLAGVAPETGRDAANTQAWRDWMQRLIDCARWPSDAAQTALMEFLKQRPWPLPVFRESIETLIRAGRPEAARDVIVLASRTFPASKWLQAQGAAVAEQLAARAASPIAASGTAAAPARLSERAFVERLDALLQAEQWAEAARHLQQTEAFQPRPAWVDAREGTIRLARVRVAHGQRDFPGTVAAARLFLNSDEARAHQLLELARGYSAADDKDYAIALAREIVRRLPGFAAGQRALKEWEPAATEAVTRASPKVSSPPSEPPAKRTTAATPSLDDPGEQLAQVKARHASGDLPGALRVARLYLNGDQQRSLRMLELAREFFAAGEKSTAVTLTNEVLRRTPGFPPAQRQLADWSPAEKK